MQSRFDSPAGVGFTCTRCGDCCRSGNVMLGPGEEEQLLALDWHGREAELVGASAIVSTAMPDGRQVKRLERREDGACIYLGADNLCRIHTHFGGEAKPLVCRLYPFGFYPIAGRVGVDCSFSCCSISRGDGLPVNDRIPEWTALLAEATPAVNERHRLSRTRPISGELLSEFEHYLHELLGDRSMPLFDRIRCCLQFNRLATTGDPTSAAAATLRQAIARGLPRQIAAIPRGGGMDRTQRVVFYQWLFLTLNPMPANADLLAGPALKREIEQRQAAAQRFASRQGKPRLDNRDLEVTWEQIDQVDAGVFTASSASVLETYFMAKIVGQRFLLAGEEEMPLMEAIPLFLLAYPMAIWTSRAIAAERGAAAVSENDLRRALSLLDRTLGQASVASLPAKLAKVWHFVIEETDLVVEATNELLGWQDDNPT